MAVLGIIPARSQSNRLPRKNVKPLGGEPLVRWAIDAARAARRLYRIVVSSDDTEILQVARECDPRLPLARPVDLAGDASLAIDYVRHALATLEAAEPVHFDAVVILQATSPFTLPADIDATVDLLFSSGADTAVTVMQVGHAVNPVKMKVFSGDRLLPYVGEERGRMAAADLPDLFVRNCSVYATRRRVIERGQVIGEDCRGLFMPRERSIDINEALDSTFVEFSLSRDSMSGLVKPAC